MVTVCRVAPAKGFQLLEKVSSVTRSAGGSGEMPGFLETFAVILDKPFLKFPARVRTHVVFCFLPACGGRVSVLSWPLTTAYVL